MKTRRTGILTAYAHQSTYKIRGFFQATSCIEQRKFDGRRGRGGQLDIGPYRPQELWLLKRCSRTQRALRRRHAAPRQAIQCRASPCCPAATYCSILRAAAAVAGCAIQSCEALKRRLCCIACARRYCRRSILRAATTAAVAAAAAAAAALPGAKQPAAAAACAI